MKIAKKLLAAVVAVMLVLSLSVCAFAAQSAETGEVKIESDWVIDEYGSIAVKVYFVNAVDLKSWDLKLNYDADMFDYADKEMGADAVQVKDNCKADLNSFTDESNPEVDGEIRVGGYFKEVLWTSEQFLESSGRGKECIVNDEKFEAAIFYLDVEDKDAFEQNGTTITIEGDMTFAAKKAVGDSITKDGAEQPTDAPATDAPATDAPATDAPATDAPATDAPATDAPATDAPATDAPATRPVEDDNDDCEPGKPGHTNCKPNAPACKPGKPSQNHPNTGDSAALAAAAGVVLLAGAAFVVSKKRK